VFLRDSKTDLNCFNLKSNTVHYSYEDKEINLRNLRRSALLRLIETEEFYNRCHNPSDGKFCGADTGILSPRVKSYLKTQYQMDADTAKDLGLRQEGSKLLIPFKNEEGKVTSYKWRDTAVSSGLGRWGPSKSQGMSIYENKTKSGPLFIVESPSEGLILAAHKQRVVFFDGADSLVSREGRVDKNLLSRLKNVSKKNDTILIPDNDTRGEAFAQVVEPLVTRRINPPAPHKDLRAYLISPKGSLDKLIK